MGHSCVGCATISASVCDGVEHVQIDGRTIFQEMLKSMGICHSFETDKLTTIQVYYVATFMDGTAVRSAFHAIAGAALDRQSASTFVPVSDMFLLMSKTT